MTSLLLGSTSSTSHLHSFAYERLNHSLTSLSTIPIALPPSPESQFKSDEEQTSSEATEKPKGKDYLEDVLRALAGSKPITRQKLRKVLQTLQDRLDSANQQKEGEVPISGAQQSLSEVDDVLLLEITARAVTVLWKETLDVLTSAAEALEAERTWWEDMAGSRGDLSIYFIQTLPHRLFSLIPRPLLPFHFRMPSIKTFQTSALFRRPAVPHRALRDMPLPISSPITLTRREVVTSMRQLRLRRDSVAEKIGFLISHAPKWDEMASGGGNGRPKSHEKTSSGRSSPEVLEIANLESISTETTRIYALLCVILDLPLPIPSNTSLSSGERSGNATPVKRSRQSTHPSASSTVGNGNALAGGATKPGQQTIPYRPPGVSSLLSIMDTTLPGLASKLREPLKMHSRPSSLTRLWIPALLVPPILIYVNRTARENREWIRQQIRNAGETVRGFFIGWVWEPLEDVANTLRGGGEGLGVAPESVKSDKASLERMVIDLGKDVYHLDGPDLDALKTRIDSGDMEAVLKVYEAELRSPVKNALMGNLIRTLLIQVQKTKVRQQWFSLAGMDADEQSHQTDLSLSLLSLDHLLKSQQLTFAFVGLAPSLLVLYGLAGWLRGVWTGDRRGKSRRRAYALALRDVEKNLLLAGEVDDSMADKDRGLLLLSVGRVRTWAAGLRGRSKEDLLDDLRLIENTSLRRNDKLMVVQRIWRGWGHDGRRLPAR